VGSFCNNKRWREHKQLKINYFPRSERAFCWRRGDGTRLR
jgi:hypothetical protein